jgi:AraC family transcriptional regulator
LPYIMFRLRKARKPELIDFSSPERSSRLVPLTSLSHDGIHVMRSTLTENEDGRSIGGAQLSIAVHLGSAMDLEWCPPGSDRKRTTRVERGMAHINPGSNPFYQRWKGTPELLIFAIDQHIIDRVGLETFGRSGSVLRPTVGVVDPDIQHVFPIWQRELETGGPDGRLFLESLAKAAIIHLFRHYAGNEAAPSVLRGGLGVARLRRVIDYIEAHLEDDLSIRDLAAVAGLSAHHFGLAFRQSTGLPPHRYLVARRIERARALLLTTDLSITQIAHTAGFASHGHFAGHFRKLLGVTPSRFRLDHR